MTVDHALLDPACTARATSLPGAAQDWKRGRTELVAALFIEWRDASMLPGRSAPSGAKPGRVDLQCDVEELDAWHGPHPLPIDVRSGTAGIVGGALETPAGPLVLGRADG